MIIPNRFRKKSNQLELINEISRSQLTPLIAEIHERFSQLIDSKRDQIESLMDLSKSTNSMFTYIITGIALGLVILGFFLIQFMKRSVINPIMVIEQHVELISQGEYMELASTGRNRLTQAFENLMSNAIKYSPGKERIDITLSRVDDTISIAFTDFGLGIPDNSRDLMFTKFYRVDNSDRRKIGGTGLGLAIVKEIVEAHKGEVSYESILGEGSTFTIRLKGLMNGSD